MLVTAPVAGWFNGAVELYTLSAAHMWFLNLHFLGSSGVGYVKSAGWGELAVC